MIKNKLKQSENSLKSNRGEIPQSPTRQIVPPPPPTRKNIPPPPPKTTPPTRNIVTQSPKNISTQSSKNVHTGQKTLQISDHMIENPLNKAEQKELNKIDDTLNKVEQEEIKKIDKEINKATEQLNNSLNKVNLGTLETSNRRRRKKKSNNNFIINLIRYLNIVTPAYKKYKRVKLYISNRVKFNKKELELNDFEFDQINIEKENLIEKRDNLLDLFKTIPKTYFPKELNFKYEDLDDVIEKFKVENFKSKIKSIDGNLKSKKLEFLKEKAKDLFKMSLDDDISSNDYNIDKLNYLDLEDFNFNDNYPSLNVKDSDIKNDKKLKEFNDILNQEDILNKLEYTLNTYNIVKKFDSLGSTAINKNELYDNILKSQQWI